MRRGNFFCSGKSTVDRRREIRETEVSTTRDLPSILIFIVRNFPPFYLGNWVTKAPDQPPH